MNKEKLIAYEKELRKLSEKEQKLRDLYLAKLAKGEYLGPQVGKPNIDKPWLGNLTEEGILFENDKKYTFEHMRRKNLSHLDRPALKYFGKEMTFGEL